MSGIRKILWDYGLCNLCKRSYAPKRAFPDEGIRSFWVRHCKACLKISEYLAAEMGTPCLMNIWIPDGFKDVPADRLTPRLRLKRSLDEILSEPYDKSKVIVAVESKVFGIGVESYTVGSNEFYQNYAAKNNICCLLDNGHYHPLEYVSDKIPALLAFYDTVAFVICFFVEVMHNAVLVDIGCSVHPVQSLLVSVRLRGSASSFALSPKTS